MAEKTAEEYRLEYEERERRHEELMRTLTVPDDDDRGTYDNRQLQAQFVESKGKGTDVSITGTSGWTAGCSQEVFDKLQVGDPYILETKGFSQITGWIIDGQWYDRKTDADLEEAHAKWKANWEREKRETLEKNRADWQARQDALPDWIRERLETFHEQGKDFALEGWGYELVVAELAVAYAEMGDYILDKDSLHIEDSEEVTRISKEQGTSGNQHDMALAIAKAHLQNPERSMEGTVSALAPLTGKAFYEE